MTDLFFLYCPENGFDCFLTLDAALDEANERIQGYLGDAWSEEVTGVCVGEITHRAKMCDQVFPDGEIDEDGFDESGWLWDPDCDYKCNYKMLPVERNPAPDVAGLVEALEWLRGAINCTPENDKHQSGAWISTKHPRIRQIDELLVAYRKQGGVL